MEKTCPYCKRSYGVVVNNQGIFLPMHAKSSRGKSRFEHCAGAGLKLKDSK